MQIIQWSPSGGSFSISNRDAFIDLLPHFFKTKNFNSFVRQLNMYGFHKVKGMHDQEFKHPFFRKGHNEFLCYIKRRYSNNHVSAKVDVKDSDVSPSKYLDLRQQFNFLNEKVGESSKEVERLSDENTKLHVICRELAIDNQKSLQKALIVIFSLLGAENQELSDNLRSHLHRLGVEMDDILPVIQTIEIEHLIEQNLLSRLFKTDNSRNIVDSLLSVLNTHIDQRRPLEDIEVLKQMLLQRAFSEINQRLVVPMTSHKLSINTVDEVADTCDDFTAKKSGSLDDFLNHI